MQTLHVFDLTRVPGADEVWRPRRWGEVRTRRPLSPLPDGFASPLGFWFSTADSWGIVVARFRVEVRDLGEQAGSDRGANGRSPRLAVGANSYRGRLKLKARGSDTARTSMPLYLEIDPGMARIRVDPDVWPRISEPVLIAVAQFWRFHAIDRLLDDLADWARGELARCCFMNPRTCGDHANFTRIGERPGAHPGLARF